MFKYLLEILISLDQLVNVVFGFMLNILLKPVYKFGDSDDTLSEVFARNLDTCKVCRFLCNLLHLFDKNHCNESID